MKWGNVLRRNAQRTGAEAIYLHLDVTSKTDWRHAIDATLDTFGRLDILFNNAGISYPVKVEDLTEEMWDRELGVHAKGAYLGTKTAIPAMRKGGGGRSLIHLQSWEL